VHPFISIFLANPGLFTGIKRSNFLYFLFSSVKKSILLHFQAMQSADSKKVYRNVVRPGRGAASVGPTGVPCWHIQRPTAPGLPTGAGSGHVAPLLEAS
jgi:hypothetical protein